MTAVKRPISSLQIVVHELNIATCNLTISDRDSWLKARDSLVNTVMEGKANSASKKQVGYTPPYSYFYISKHAHI